MTLHISRQLHAVVVCLLIAATPAVWAKDAMHLMQDSDKRLKAGDESVQYDMELYDANKLVHSRKLTRLDKRLPGKSSTVVRFSAPVSVKNVSLLIEDSGVAVNDIWSYTSSTKSLRRISGAQKQNWFMGTEFTYEDFEDYKLNAYQFTEIEPQAPCLSWAKCRVVEVVPKSSAEVQASGYGKKRYYLEAQSLFPVQVEYFDRTDKLVKRLMTEGLKKYGEYSRATAQTMLNLTNNHRTRMVVTSLSINPGLSESQFTQRYLRSEED